MFVNNGIALRKFPSSYFVTLTCYRLSIAISRLSASDLCEFSGSWTDGGWKGPFGRLSQDVSQRQLWWHSLCPWKSEISLVHLFNIFTLYRWWVMIYYYVLYIYTEQNFYSWSTFYNCIFKLVFLLSYLSTQTISKLEIKYCKACFYCANVFFFICNLNIWFICMCHFVFNKTFPDYNYKFN